MKTPCFLQCIKCDMKLTVGIASRPSEFLCSYQSNNRVSDSKTNINSMQNINASTLRPVLHLHSASIASKTANENEVSKTRFESQKRLRIMFTLQCHLYNKTIHCKGVTNSIPTVFLN